MNVLDIGCNDGSLLEQFAKRGFSVFGVDPAVNLRKITEQKKIPVIVDFWNEAFSKS
jgi:2-polyprenyl-3-methyl-5-hydroxy-6-metoxy-1,4-benzoquinol methylase